MRGVNIILIVQKYSNDCDEKSDSVICFFLDGRSIVSSYVYCQE